jgi:fatty-acyl-CoA synthase
MDSLVDIIRRFEGCDSLITFVDARGISNVHYSSLYRVIKSKADAYSSLGIHAGDRVVIALDSSQSSVTQFLALLLIGAEPVSIKPRIPGGNYNDYVAGIVREQRARAYVPSPTDPPILIGRNNRLKHRNTEGIAFIQYTSGSIASPKPVPLSHEAVLHNTRGVNRRYGRSRHDCMLNVIPLCHDMGLVGGLLTSIVEGHDIVMVDPRWFLRAPISVLELGVKRRVTTAPLPNFIARYLLKILRNRRQPRRPYFELWNSIYIGSEPIKRQMVEDLLSTGAHYDLNPKAVIFSYGMAEAALVVSSRRLDTVATSFDSVGSSWHANNGTPLQGIEIALGSQSVGGYKEIKIRGKSLFNAPQYSETGRWYNTGDVGYLKNGDLFVVGRNSDYVVVDGCNLHAADMEQLIYRETDFKDAIIQPINGRLHVWLVSSRTDAVDFKQIRRILKTHFSITDPFLESIKPGHIVRTASGKIVKDLTIKRLTGPSGFNAGHEEKSNVN